MISLASYKGDGSLPLAASFVDGGGRTARMQA